VKQPKKPDKSTAATVARKEKAPNDDDDVGSPKPALKKLGRVTLNGNRPIFDVFRLDSYDGKTLDVALPQSDAKNERTVLKVLHDVGAALPENVAQAKAVVSRLVEASPRCPGGQIATRWGWLGMPGEMFIANNRWITRDTKKRQLGRRSIAIEKKQNFACAHFDEKKDYNILGPAALAPETDGVFRRAGTLEGWQKGIGKIATYSSVLRLSVTLPLAAPLVALLGAERFLVFLTGPSSHGKTTAEIAAGSVIGRPSLDDLPNWNISDPRLEEVGRYHHDNVLIVDDLKTAGGIDKTKFDHLQHIIHWMTGGGRRGRLTKAVGNITGRSDSHLSFRVLVLSSYEYPVAKIAERANTTFDPGDLVRTLDVDATPPGSVLIFDALPKKLRGGDPRANAEKLLADIRAMSLQHHGVLFLSWIKVLIADPDRAKRFVKRSMDEFLSAAKLETASPQEKRHAKHFALIYAAGAYAIERKLLPWNKASYQAAILKCHHASRTRLRGALSGVASGLARLDSHLRDRSRILDWPASGTPQLSGLVEGWRKRSASGVEYFIPGPSFRNWFSSNAEYALVKKHLLGLSWLKTTTNGATTDVRVNGGQKKVRCYHLIIPQGQDLGAG
jgi:hypothetical protein